MADLSTLMRDWLADYAADHDVLTVQTAGYYVRALPFTDVSDLASKAAITDWRRSQLKVVCAETVKKKASVVHQLCLWLAEHGHIDRAPTIDPLPARALGVRDTKRKHKLHAVPLTMEQADAWVYALPEWAWPARDVSRKFRCRDRFIVAKNRLVGDARHRRESRELAAREARPRRSYMRGRHAFAGPARREVGELRAPEDYHRGARELLIRDEADKARWGRSLALDEETLETLDRVCPDVGLLFGKHDHRGQLRLAARAALPLDICERVTQYDLRHARLTWMLENTQNLAGVAYQSGHKRADTLSAYYIHPSKRAQESALRDCTRARQLNLFTDDERH